MNAPLLQLLQAAYTAQAAIERMQNLADMLQANSDLGAYAKALMEAPPDLQDALCRIHVGPNEGVPRLQDLQQGFHAAYVALYSRIHNTQPAAA